jgi:serine phosphatase RsbU (regulator of sigma subunit)
MFGFAGLEQAIAAGPASDPKAMLDHLNAEIKAFVGDAEPRDDVTIVVLQPSG